VLYLGYRAIFKDSTEFIFNREFVSGTGFIQDTVKTVNIDGQWVAEYNFMLDVYDTVVATPELRFLDETILDHENTEALTVEFGDQIVVEDISAFLTDNNARPDRSRFRIRTNEENEEDRTYFSVGTFNREGDFQQRIIDTITFSRIGEFVIELEAERERTDNLRASKDTYEVPTIFTVVPLNEDLEVVATIPTFPIRETDDDRILIPISSPLANLDGNPAGDFTVEVDGAPRTVVGVSRSQLTTAGGDIFGLLALVLETPLDPSDATKTVTVSYNGTSIISADERILQPFSDQAIEVNVPVPVELIGDITNEGGKILLPLSQNIDRETITNSSDPAQGFTVMLNGSPATISTVGVNVDDEKLLEIELSEGVFDDDDIEISFTGPGDILSIGLGQISDIASTTVISPFVNLLDGDSGMFENPLDVDWMRTGNTTITNLEIVAPPTPDTVTSVEPSGNVIHFTINENGGTNKTAVFAQAINPPVLEMNKSYRIKFKRYVVDDASIANNQKANNALFRFENAGTPRKDVSLGLGHGNSANTGQWIEGEILFTADTPAYVNGSFKILMAFSAYVDIYLDDLELHEFNPRP